MTLPPDNASRSPGGPVRLLSFDLEEYFQVEAAAGAVAPGQWDSFAQRMPAVVERILERLASRGSTATFFVLGWVALRQGDLIRRIAHAGHEIASHGMAHTMIHRMTPRQFRDDVSESRQRLEDLSGQAVLGYRAPTFSITRATAWALDVLVEAGFAYDSSVFPIRHDRYGVPDAPRFAHWAIGPAGGGLLEIPPLTLRILGGNMPVGGGGYLRLLPLAVVKAALHSAARADRPAMIYLHPWELDPRQPPLPMSRLNRFRHRLGLSRMEGKLQALLERYRFTSVAARVEEIRPNIAERFVYGG